MHEVVNEAELGDDSRREHERVGVLQAHRAIEEIAEAWTALSSALNSFNRSMGLQDAYPFVLAPAVVTKLGFIHDLVHGRVGNAAKQGVSDELAKDQQASAA